MKCTSKIESCSVSRCTYFRYLHHIRGLVAGRPATHSFTNQPSFHKLIMHSFKLDLDISQYPTLHDLINSMEDSDIFQLHDTQENEDKNKLFIKCLDEHTLTASKNTHTDLSPQSNNNQISMPIDDSAEGECSYKVTQHVHA